MTDNSLGMGVVYSSASFAGFIRRAIIIFVDLFLVLNLYLLGESLDDYLYITYDSYEEYYGLYASIFLIYLYLTIIKTSRFGTVGLALTKSKIVTIVSVHCYYLQIV